MKSFSNLQNCCILILLANRLLSDEGSAISKVEMLGGQVLGIAQNTKGVRVLIPPKTFEGRVLTDDDLAVLLEIDNIVELDLKNADITDSGLAHLASLTDLERLHLEKTKITDSGLAHLKALTKLKYLNLYGTGVSDKGLDALRHLADLERLYLWQTKVSFEAAKEFHKHQIEAGNERLEINLGWEKEILSPARIVALKEQRSRSDAESKNDHNDHNDQNDQTDRKDQNDRASSIDDPDFKIHILPIFQNRCIQCHGDEKQKDDLRLDSYEYVLKGGEHGAVVIGEDLIGSRLFQRITLPENDEDLMPPKDGPLSENEIALIKNWISNGAKAEVKVSQSIVANDHNEPDDSDSDDSDSDSDDHEVSSVFTEYVLPIFKDTCTDCHGEEKQKAGLALHSLSAVLKGSDEGEIVKGGNPDGSALFRRITLPKGDDDIMPPKGDPLSKAQIDLIKLWIISGAK